MAVTFCLRLAAGLILVLPILNPAQIPPRFFRVQFLTALGLLAVVGILLFETATLGFWLIYAAAAVGCVIGSIVWHLDKAPGGRAVVILAPIAVTACLIYGGMLELERGDADTPLRIVDNVAAALVLGSATTAMLMGHSYLIAPAMTIAPLMRLLAALAGSVMLRIVLAGVGLWLWTSSRSPGTLETELLLWLPVRWALGLIAPSCSAGWRGKRPAFARRSRPPGFSTSS